MKASLVVLGRLGLVAVDGTKIAASASKDANRAEGRLRELAAAILAEAEQTDAAEDALPGGARGDELRPSWPTRSPGGSGSPRRPRSWRLSGGPPRRRGSSRPGSTWTRQPGRAGGRRARRRRR